MSWGALSDSWGRQLLDKYPDVERRHTNDIMKNFLDDPNLLFLVINQHHIAQSSVLRSGRLRRHRRLLRTHVTSSLVVVLAMPLAAVVRDEARDDVAEVGVAVWGARRGGVDVLMFGLVAFGCR